ncbi:MAG: preprotein translocase subunit SecE [Clostridia bacterium]|nr:preprotein translocase subunit SecE [Clostridia bacterium]
MAKDMPVKENQGVENTAKVADNKTANDVVEEVVSAPESDFANVEVAEKAEPEKKTEKSAIVKGAKTQSNNGKVQTKNTESKAKPVAEAQKPSFRAQAEKSSNPKTGKAIKKGKDGKPKKNIFKKMFNGIKSIISELKKVTWPKGKTVASNTLIVLVFVISFLIVIFVFDYVLSGLLSLLMGTGWVNLFG